MIELAPDEYFLVLFLVVIGGLLLTLRINFGLPEEDEKHDKENDNEDDL